MKHLKEAVANLECDEIGRDAGLIHLRAWTSIEGKVVDVDVSYNEDLPSEFVDLVYAQVVTYLLEIYYFGDVEDEKNNRQDNKARKYVFNM